MLKYSPLFCLSLFVPFVYSCFALAQDAVAQSTNPSTDLAIPLLESLGGAQGASSMAVVAVVVQVIMLVVNSQYGAIAGKYRLALMYGMNIIGCVVALKIQGTDIFTAITHANTVAAYQVFLNQGFKQFFQKTS